MKVIGAGFGRTGTKSLQLALERIGYGPCYHMEELFRNPEGVIHWKNAYEEKETDWGTLFTGYESAVDFPVSMYYKELHKYFPDAKIILTLRDSEKWYNSAFNTIFSFDPGIGFKLKLLLKTITSSKARNLLKVLQLNDKSIWGKFFNGKFKDKEATIAKYNNHIEEVKQNIPSDQLLLFSVKDGWEPLCSFLGVQVPEEDFPNTNKGQDFAEWAKGIVLEVINGK